VNIILPQNDLEVKAVKQLVKVATEMNLDFRVITPYEGQRARVEGMLKNTGLPHEDRVFNVDSFQGE
jgi:superfamily I DNA and/or RNA helicase